VDAISSVNSPEVVRAAVVVLPKFFDHLHNLAQTTPSQLNLACLGLSRGLYRLGGLRASGMKVPRPKLQKTRLACPRGFKGVYLPGLSKKTLQFIGRGW